MPDRTPELVALFAHIFRSVEPEQIGLVRVWTFTAPMTYDIGRGVVDGIAAGLRRFPRRHIMRHKIRRYAALSAGRI
jgi:hypothetical protein